MIFTTLLPPIGAGASTTFLHHLYKLWIETQYPENCHQTSRKKRAILFYHNTAKRLWVFIQGLHHSHKGVQAAGRFPVFSTPLWKSVCTRIDHKEIRTDKTNVIMSQKRLEIFSYSMFWSDCQLSVVIPSGKGLPYNENFYRGYVHCANCCWKNLKFLNPIKLLLSQVMTGGVDEDAKELLNLSDCMEYCQVTTSAKRKKPHKRITDHLSLLASGSMFVVVIYVANDLTIHDHDHRPTKANMLQTLAGITGLSLPSFSWEAFDQPTICTCHRRATKVKSSLIPSCSSSFEWT